jgi:glycosyltransferase involved in cell wall biosynthesis
LAALSRWKMEARDRIFYSAAVRQLIARLLTWRLRKVNRQSSMQQVVASLTALCRIARLAGKEEFQIAIEGKIRDQISLLGDRRPDWSVLSRDWNPGQIEKAVLLKPYIGPRERGVVLVSFENQWTRLMGIRNLEEFARRYTLVVAPTWSPPHTLACALFPAQYPADRIFTLISNAQDAKIFPRLSSTLSVVPLYAANWVNPDLYEVVPWERKDIDIIMVAAFGKYKRHLALFQALRELPREFRVLVAGQPSDGRTAATLLGEARLYGVQDRFQIRESVPHHEITRLLARAKISVVLSRQEGSCVVVAESLFANTPVGVYEDAVVGSRTFVHKQTGRLLQHESLAVQLRDFVASSEQYSPREWALREGIGCDQSTVILNRALKESALRSGQDWTHDIAVHHWCPDPVLLRAEDRKRLLAAREDILSRHGVRIGKP